MRNQFGKIKRSEKVTIVAYDESGKNLLEELLVFLLKSTNTR